jgi:hypothetical protein
MKKTKIRRLRRQRGTALPAVLAMTVGVGALTSGYVLRNLREHGRESFDRDNEMSLYDAWSQMEVTTRLINASPYDGSGRNAALEQALSRTDGQFIDSDGWPTGVVAVASGGTGSGFFDIVSTATRGQAKTRVTALVRERQSFADFNYFVNAHPLGISGGSSAVFPYSDAPEGSIHSNDKLLFYFPDRHFRDAVTAVNGFEYLAGARGPGDSSGQNNWFHGPVNDHSNAINGLTDVDIPAFTARTDNLLSLTGDYDFAKVHLKGGTALVEQWQRAHAELQNVSQQVESFHSENRTRTVDDYAWVPTLVPKTVAVYQDQVVPVYTTISHHDLVTAAWSETVTVPNMVQVLVTAAWVETKTVMQNVTTVVVDQPAWDETVTTTTMVSQQVWVSGGGGADTGGSGGSGGVGYWTTQMVPVTTTSIVHHNAVTHNVVTQVPVQTTINHPAVYQTVQQGTKQVTVNHPAVYHDWTEQVQTGTTIKKVKIGTTITYVTKNVWTKTGSHQETYQVQVSDGFHTVTTPMMVQVPEHKVQDHVLNAYGTVYVKGDVYFVPMTVGTDGYDTHVLDGSMTFASDANVYIQDSIVYGKKDTSNVLQKAYLNGDSYTAAYVPNDQYHGSSVLGLVANYDVVYTSAMPANSEINATLLTKTGEVKVEGVTVNTDGTVSPTSGGWVKMSLRRLGGMTTNLRPVSAYVDSNNAITRGFVYAKSVYDVRQRTTPPRGFPTLNRPRVLATVLKEVR